MVSLIFMKDVFLSINC